MGAGKDDPILNSLQTNLSTNVVDGWLVKGGSASDLSILGAPFNKGGPKEKVGWRWSTVIERGIGARQGGYCGRGIRGYHGRGSGESSLKTKRSRQKRFKQEESLSVRKS